MADYRKGWHTVYDIQYLACFRHRTGVLALDVGVGNSFNPKCGQNARSALIGYPISWGAISPVPHM